MLLCRSYLEQKEPAKDVTRPVKSWKWIRQSIPASCYRYQIERWWLNSTRMKCCKAIREILINGGNEALVASRNNELQSYEKKIDESEDALISIGPCPVLSCTKHHETSKDVQMDEMDQYVDSDFKPVSPNHSAQIRSEKPKSPIKTANMFQNLMDLEDQVKENSPPRGLKFLFRPLI
ncbi:hypothetical protein AVEN_61192-1 [Araneus ventricosus]|uniref:Uncharacterized protein n=1 Tax=Araneus ventricosus TaxID=182803 RepID=A0A4Y2SBG0_ARAVE|nr:hypothetical protein AVEN_61192-1 [Araneus ventricosus]